jgi:hypothetical protein
MAQPTTNPGLDGGDIQAHQNNENVAVAVDPKVLPKEERSPHACQLTEYIAEEFGGKRFYQLSSEELMGLMYRLSTLSLELCPG